MADANTYEWTGAADASPSVKRVNGAVIATNTLPNPAFRKGMTGYGTETVVTATQQADGSMRVITSNGQGQSFVVRNVPNFTDFTLVVVGRSFQGGTTAVYGGTPQGQQINFTSQWATYYLDLTTADQGNLYFAVLSAGSNPGNGFDLKSLMLVPGKGYRGGYFDGSTVRGTTYSWAGTANASISQMLVDGALSRINYVSNPSFETGVSLWGNAGGAGGSVAAQSTGGLFGPACAVVTTGTADVSGAQTVLANVPLGSDFTASAHVLAPVGAKFKLRLSNNLNFAIATAAVGTGAWQRLSVTMPAANVTAAPSVQIVADGTGAQVSVLVDGVMLERASTLGDYFDGSFPWEIYGTAQRISTSTSASAGAPQFTTAATRESTSDLTADEDQEFTTLVERIIESESAGWGSVPALLSVGYDSVGPFRVGDSPLTAWAIEVDSAVNLYGVFDSGEVSILDPAGQVVAVRPSPFIDNDTLIVTIPVGTFTTAGIYRLVPRLIGRGSVTLESVPIVVEADDGWQTLASARAVWADAPVDDGYLFTLLDVARIQCIFEGPDFEGRAPKNFALAQLLQARALWALSLIHI